MERRTVTAVSFNLKLWMQQELAFVRTRLTVAVAKLKTRYLNLKNAPAVWIIRRGQQTFSPKSPPSVNRKKCEIPCLELMNAIGNWQQKHKQISCTFPTMYLAENEKCFSQRSLIADVKKKKKRKHGNTEVPSRPRDRGSVLIRKKYLPVSDYDLSRKVLSSYS